MRVLSPLACLLLVAGCVATSDTGGRPATVSRPAPAAAPAGIDPILGRDAAAIVALLGTPALDMREGPARKLQFRGTACVLDAYLYPPAGGGPQRATYFEARTPQGNAADRAACVAALMRR